MKIFETRDIYVLDQLLHGENIGTILKHAIIEINVLKSKLYKLEKIINEK